MKAINQTSLRRAAAYLDGLPHHGCNEVKTLFALIEQAQADIHNGLTAMLPVQRSHDIRAKQLIAFNVSRQAGCDVDEALEAAHLAMLRNSSSTVEAPAPGLYAIRHLSNWDGEGDVCVTLATYSEKGDGIWRYHENGGAVLEYQGDKILQVWPLTDGSAPTLTFDAGLEAATGKVRAHIEQFRQDYGVPGATGLELEPEHQATVSELHRLRESIGELASANPVPLAPIYAIPCRNFPFVTGAPSCRSDCNCAPQSSQVNHP